MDILPSQFKLKLLGNWIRCHSVFLHTINVQVAYHLSKKSIFVLSDSEKRDRVSTYITLFGALLYGNS